jgi:nitroimidazol reductase NimA-like FMN-containing flavoprotein (pyridoxamine 5'-phosphate oxidase superfamily)
MNATDLVAMAREVVEANVYLTLATADADGAPWASPVWYAHAEYREFFWVSRPEARHSRNIAVRPGIAIVIFDSTAAPGRAQAVYVEAHAEEVEEDDRARAMRTYSDRSEATGASRWTSEDVTGSAAHRLYRATATGHYVLGTQDRRLPVPMSGKRWR